MLRRADTPRGASARDAALLRRTRLNAIAALVLAAFCTASRPVDIGAVLDRSQHMQLEALAAQQSDTNGERAAVLRRTFAELLTAAGLPDSTPLLVFRGPLLATCLMGEIVAVNEAVAELPPSEQRFILAHELGHLRGQHWSEVQQLYARLITGEVTKAKTDAVADELGREASTQARRHEFEADAFALNLIRRLGDGVEGSIAVLHRLPMVAETPTHPSTAARLGRLQALASD